MQYFHPVLSRKGDEFRGSGIIDTTCNDPADMFDLFQGNPMGKLEILSIEEFHERMRKDRQIRENLGIPPMNYLAFSYSLARDDLNQVARKLIEKCREIGYELRAWVVPESANLVICAATEDMTEDSGWDIYEWANIDENAPSDSYGHSSWYEFCLFGVPIFADWKLEERNNKLVAVHPDGDKVAFFGF
jgi:hypothetical protein